jgi:cardiolipin synthase
MNVPNILSLIRLCAVPIVPLVYFSEMPGSHLWAAAIYLAASLTDVLDGYIARKYNLITKLGRVLDPLADKLMSFCVLVCIIMGGLIPYWAGVVFFVKETFMGLGALLQYKKIDDVLPSNFLGKISTVFFFAVCFLILVANPQPDEFLTLRVAAISAALGLNILALIIYLWRFTRNTKRSQV